MTLARSVADVLSDHVTLEIESIDRMYLNLYVPKLQYESGIVGFFRGHLGYTFASSALMDPITKGFVNDIEHFCDDEGVDLIKFEKGQRKDDILHEYLDAFEGNEGVLFVGKARRRPRRFAPRSAPTPTRASPIRGSCGRQRWSTSTTSTASTPTSVPSSSSSARTSRTTPNCA
jgi:hypothetical protein